MNAISTEALTLDDLMSLTGRQLHRILDAAHPFDEDAVAGHHFVGADLSMPALGHKLLWQTFRKSFVRDEQHGDVRGWNTRMEQRGIHGAQVPMLRRDGSDKTFAHYRVRDARTQRWPRGWHGEQYLDYKVAGNGIGDRWTFTPLVAVNEGSSELLLGWEIFKVAGRLISPSMYWALQRGGPVEQPVAPKHAPSL
ncbi:MAG: hypothetical protein V9E83_04060 [Baekduia sp.]